MFRRQLNRRGCLVAGGVSLLNGSRTRADAPLTRAEFARRLATLPRDTGTEQVRAALGPPDDVCPLPYNPKSVRQVRFHFKALQPDLPTS
jgi:hypothetical protein